MEFYFWRDSMNKNSNVIRTVTEIGLFAALGFVFDELQSAIFKGIFPNGGSIGFAMIAVVIIAYRRGIIPAFLTGLIMGALDVATGPFIVAPWQVFLDYIFPYTFVAVCGIFVPYLNKAKKESTKSLLLILSIIAGGMLKFLSHYLSGVLFFDFSDEFAWNLNNMSGALYSFIYNIAFMGPCIVLTCVLAYILRKRVPHLFEYQLPEEVVEYKHTKTMDCFFKPMLVVLGIALLTISLIRFIKGIEVEQYPYYYYDATDVSVNVNAFMMLVNALLIILIGTISIKKSFKHTSNNRLLMFHLGSISVINVIYAIGRIIKLYRKYPTTEEKMVKFDYETTIMWSWFGAALFIAVIFAAFYFYLRETSQEKQN